MRNVTGRALLGRWLSAPIMLMLCLVGLNAHAQEAPKEPVVKGPTPKVLMLPTSSVNDSVSSIIPQRIGEQIHAGIKKDARVELMPSYEEIRKKLGGQGVASAVIAEAEKLYTSGIGLLTAGEDQKAADAFQRSVDLMEQNIADIGNFEILADAMSNLSLAYHNGKFEVDAKKRMQQFAHIRPNTTLDPEKYPKALIKIFDKEKKKSIKGGPGKLTITANVKGARVFIDGVEKGATPVTVADVGFGHHYLVVRGPTGGVWSEKIRVKGRGKAQTFKVELGTAAVVKKTGGKSGDLPTYYVDLNEKIKTGRFGTDLQPYTSELARETGAAYIAWVVMFKEDRKYKAVPFVYRSEDGLFVQGESTLFNIELSNLRKGVSELSARTVEMMVNTPEDKAFVTVVLGPSPVIVAVAPTKTPTPVETPTESPYADASVQAPPETPPSDENNTWTYVAVGGGVLVAVALIAGGVYLLADDDNPDAANGFDAVVSW